MDDSSHLHAVGHPLVFDPQYDVGRQHVADPPIDVDLQHDVHLRDVLLHDAFRIRFSGMDHQELMVYGDEHRPFEPGFRLRQVSSSMYHLPIHELF